MILHSALIYTLKSEGATVSTSPQFASLYPGLDPMVWETATELAAKLLAQHALQPSPGSMLNNRVLPEEHFEFQGGMPRGSSWNGRGRVSLIPLTQTLPDGVDERAGQGPAQPRR